MSLLASDDSLLHDQYLTECILSSILPPDVRQRHRHQLREMAHIMWRIVQQQFILPFLRENDVKRKCVMYLQLTLGALRVFLQWPDIDYLQMAFAEHNHELVTFSLLRCMILLWPDEQEPLHQPQTRIFQQSILGEEPSCPECNRVIKQNESIQLIIWPSSERQPDGGVVWECAKCHLKRVWTFMEYYDQFGKLPQITINGFGRICLAKAKAYDMRMEPSKLFEEEYTKQRMIKLKLDRTANIMCQ